MSRNAGLLGTLGLAVGVTALYLPLRGMQLWSDDFLLAQMAHAARHDWRLLFAGLDAFYRPTTTWTFMLDRLLWGHWAGGYHLTNVALRIGNAVLLFAALRRFRFPALSAWVTALLWACSQFSAEPVYNVGTRIDELFLASWLVLAVAWPRTSESWSARRAAVVAAALVFGAFSKETWIVTAGLVFALEFAHHEVGARRALAAALPVAGLSVLYLILHLTLLPRGDSYFSWTLAPLAKIPHQMAAFLFLEPFTPIAFRASPLGAVGCAVVAAVAVLVWRRDRGAAAFGGALLVLPQLPTLFVPYLPVRYTSIPYAGFLVLMVAGARQLAATRRDGLRRLVTVAGGGLAAIVATVGVLTVRADLDDLRRVSDWHERLLVEARAVAGALPVGVPIAVVRLETDIPLREVALSLRGLPKLFYPRLADAYALTDTAALFDWVLEPEHLIVRRFETPRDGLAPGPGRAVLHDATGFRLDPRAIDDVASWAAGLRRRGLGVRVLRVSRFD